MWELSHILGQTLYNREIWQGTSPRAHFDLENLLSAAFFLAALTAIGVMPSLSDWVRKHRRPRPRQALRQERHVC